MPNLFAYLVVALFPVLGLVAFAKLPRATATVGVVLVGSVLLPEGVAFDFPFVPPLDKEYVTYLSVLLGALVYRPRDLAAARPGLGPEAVVLLLLVSNIVTAATNPDPMMDEGILEPGLGYYDVIAQVGDDLLGLALPFLLGRALLTSKDDLPVLMTMLAGAGLVYTGLILVEVVLSIPYHVFHLSRLIYGFSAGLPSWRWGVIQPFVFMEHGLSIATFMALCVIGSSSLRKSRMKVYGLGASLVTAIVLFGLLMSRNVAGIVYGFVVVPVTLVFRPRTAALLGLALALLSCIYPAMRMFDLFPHRELVSLASSFDAERARSLEGRFEEEEFVLGRVGDHFWFGWGNYGRTPGAATFGGGAANSGLDGYWTIRFGSHGLVGLMLVFGLLALPVVLAWRRHSYFDVFPAGAMLAALMAMVSIRSVDLLINGWWNNLPVFLAGALFGISRSRWKRQTTRPALTRRGPRLPSGNLAEALVGARSVQPSGRQGR